MEKFDWKKYELYQDNEELYEACLKKYAHECHKAFENGEKLKYDKKFYYELEKYDDRMADIYYEDCVMMDRSTLVKLNQGKTIAPALVLDILYTYRGRHFTQAKLMEMIFDIYEVKVDRKAFSRNVHTLADVMPHVHCSRKDGVWMDKANEFHSFLDDAA